MTQWDANLYDDKHAYVFGYGREVVDMLDPKPGERILDLGCGTGHLTQEIADRGAQVIGVDSSREMITQARARYPVIEFRLTDARVMKFETPFDAVFSNAALHWIHEAGEVIGRIVEALRPGGRFVAEFGGKGNVVLIQDGIRHALEAVGTDPSAVFPIWYFPSIAEYSRLLEEKGLEVLWAALVSRDVVLDDPVTGLRDWVRMFAGSALQAVPDQWVDKFYSVLETRCRVQLYRDNAWHADYRRIRVIARKAHE